MTRPAIRIAAADRIDCEAVVLGCFKAREPEAGSWKPRVAAAVRTATARPGWRGLDGQITRSATRGSRPVQVEVHGLGPRTQFTPQRLRSWLQRLVERADGEGWRQLGVVLPRHAVTAGRAALRVGVDLTSAGYRFDRFKRGRRRARLRSVHLLPGDGEVDALRRALRVSGPISRAVSWARDLSNMPPNEATPDWMAQRAEELAARWSMDCEILGVDQLRERGMGGMLAVAGGSSCPPRMVRLEWGQGEETVALVGKGVTFDTGGISIKPSRSMEEMKYDKCGACTVLGIAQATAALKLPLRLRAYLPLVENMPDGASYRPGDIVRCLNGKTVEILDTDAEGRLILADALAWAAAEKPDLLVEYSTLTGASMVALGRHGAALYSRDDELAEELLRAAESSGERLWRMPLWPEFRDEMEGVHADLRNLGGRWGGANHAACFLAEFVGPVRSWAHLDIAATAYRASREEQRSGATGFGVALTLDWLLARTSTF